MKRPRRDERASDKQMKEEDEDEDEDERLAEERLQQLQQFAEKSMAETSSSAQSSSLKACQKSSWQQIGNLLLYTAAGVKGSDKVGTVSNEHLMKVILMLTADCVDLLNRRPLHV